MKMAMWNFLDLHNIIDVEVNSVESKLVTEPPILPTHKIDKVNLIIVC